MLFALGKTMHVQWKTSCALLVVFPSKVPLHSELSVSETRETAEHMVSVPRIMWGQGLVILRKI